MRYSKWICTLALFGLHDRCGSADRGPRTRFDRRSYCGRQASDVGTFRLFMLNAMLVVILSVILVLSGYQHVAVENAALRQQVLVLKRHVKRPRLHRRDRLFWMGLRTIWPHWKSALDDCSA